MIAVCVPSRGLIHSRTMEHIGMSMDSLGANWALIVSSDQGIPDAFNEVAEDALSVRHYRYVWFVEEDMGFPLSTLERYLSVLEAGADVVASDYPVRSGIMAAKYRADGTLDYTGLGCTLIKAATLRAVLPFSSDFAYAEGGDEQVPVNPAHPRYGLHDVHFHKRLRSIGARVEVGATPLWQYRVREYGKPLTNAGVHTIDVLR